MLTYRSNQAWTWTTEIDKLRYGSSIQIGCPGPYYFNYFNTAFRLLNAVAIIPLIWLLIFFAANVYKLKAFRIQGSEFLIQLSEFSFQNSQFSIPKNQNQEEVSKLSKFVLTSKLKLSLRKTYLLTYFIFNLLT